MSIACCPFASAAPLAGEERKNRGEDEATFCRNARGVARVLLGVEAISWSRDSDFLEAVAGLSLPCWELLVERAGVTERLLLRDRRETGEDIFSSYCMMKEHWTWTYTVRRRYFYTETRQDTRKVVFSRQTLAPFTSWIGSSGSAYFRLITPSTK